MACALAASGQKLRMMKCSVPWSKAGISHPQPMESWHSGKLAGVWQLTLPPPWFLHCHPTLATTTLPPVDHPASLFERVIQPCWTGLVLFCCFEAAQLDFLSRLGAPPGQESGVLLPLGLHGC